MSVKTKNPLFNTSVKTFLDVALIEVICNTPNARIYYTVDGSDPNTNSNYILSGQNIKVKTVGNHILKCLATSRDNSGNTIPSSDIVSFAFKVIANSNFIITNTSDTYVTKQSSDLEPTYPNGAQMYVDLTQFLPDKLINQDGFMELVYMFQDYMNNGFRLIPKPCSTITYQKKLSCGAIEETTNIEWLEPYNHDISMLLDYENESQTIGITKVMEKYDRNRDISTFSFSEEEIGEYKNKYSEKLSRGRYYDNYVYYKNINELSNILPEDAKNYHIFISTLDNANTNNSDIQSQVEFKSKIHEYLKYYEGKLLVNLYFCSYEDFENNFTYNGSYTLQSTYYPTFDGIYDNYNLEKVQTIKSFNNKTDLKDYLVPDTKRFRISILLNSIDDILGLTNIDSEMSVTLIITDASQLSSLPRYCPLLAPRFNTIYQWQDPTTFYNYFSCQNQYRIDDKRSSILEKIHRLAYLKDVDVIDYKFVEFIASQMGYNIEVEREDIEDNEYYRSNEEKEKALREIIRNLPNFYKIKCTKNGLEALLLSFGLVGEVVYLYTIGNEKQQGYADFIDAKLIEGSDDSDIFNISEEDMEYNKTVNVSLSSSVVSDWFPSPHFRIELDILKQNLRLDTNKLGIELVNKAVRKTKPINTVFQGFYGKMVSNFGYLFLHKPKGLMKGYSFTSIGESCDTLDVWDSRCN